MINKYTKEKVVLKYIVTIIFFIFGFAIAVFLAIDYFGIMFGANNSYDEPVNNLSTDYTFADRVPVGDTFADWDS